MLKRLAFGLLKGLAIGGAIGAGVHYGLGWVPLSGLLGFLLAMGAGGTTGIFAGRPPWQEGAWIEAVLKGMVGVGLGALAYWGIAQAPWLVPFPGVDEPATLAGLPLVFLPAVAGVYGALVELDNTKSAGDEKEEGSSVKARVMLDDLDETEVHDSSKKEKKKRA